MKTSKMQQRELWNLLSCLFFFLQCICQISGKGDGGQQGNWQQGLPQPGWNSGGQTKGGAPLGGWDDEVTNPWGGYPEDTSQWKLEDSVPGVPGQSYPNLGKIPETSFDCRKQKSPGYYGDIETQCQVFHICQAGGRQNSFLCPVGTIFNQETFVCDWWFNVNCADATNFYDRNMNLHRGSDIGIDGNKIKRAPIQSNSKGSDQLPPVGIPSWDQGNTGNWGMNQNIPQGWGNAAVQRDTSKGSRGPSDIMAGGNRNQKGAPGMGQRMSSWTKGDTRRMPNQGMNIKGPAMVNTGKGQRDLSGGHRMGQNQGGQRMGQKGMTQSHGVLGVNQNVRPNQKGAAQGGNRVFMRRMGVSSGMKGDVRRVQGRGMENQQIADGHLGQNNAEFQNRRMKGSSGQRVDTNKGFNANSWSMGSRGFQNQGNTGDNMWQNGPNTKGPALVPDNNPWPNDGSRLNPGMQNNAQFKGRSENANWNQADVGFNQWNNDIVANNAPSQYNSFENANNFAQQNNWGYDYGYTENSWSHKDKQWNESQASENDYDYSYTS